MVLFLFYTLHSALPFCVMGNPLASNGIVINCYKVLQSSYDSVFGVPLDVLAAVYFIINLGLVYLVSFGSDRVFRRSFKLLFGWRCAACRTGRAPWTSSTSRRETWLSV